MENTEKVLGNKTEAQTAIMNFELWQSMLLDGTMPNPKRYETEVLDFYKDKLAGTNAPFYFMFMGFLGGLDFAMQTKKGQELLKQAQDLAAEACQNWKPEEEPAQDQKRYYTISRSMEEMQEAAKEYEESPAGKRFVKTIENAKEFTLKHSNGTLYMMQLNYLANKHYNSLLNGSFDLTALAYRQGYMKGKAAAKK